MFRMLNKINYNQFINNRDILFIRLFDTTKNYTIFTFYV